MRIYVNEKKVQFRKRVGQYASLFGLIVLVVGMIITFRVRPEDPRYPFWIGMALAALFVGFIAAQVGNYNMRRFARQPRMDEVLNRSLKGFDNKYEIYHWLLPADHVLLGPAGVYVFALRDTKDPVLAEGIRWRQPFRLTRVLGIFGQEGLGDPVGEAMGEAERLQKWLREALPDVEVEVDPLVFFVQPVKITRNDPAVPPILPKELKNYLRNQQRKQRLPDPVRRRLSELFRTAAQRDGTS